MNPQIDFVMKTIKSRDVHFVRLWFTDVLGTMKSFAVSPSEIEGAFADGMGFDGSCVAGFSPTEESDMLAFPDPETFQVLPWRPSDNAVARMFCDIRTPDGAAFEGDPRNVLRRMVDKAAEAGYIFNVGPELEYYYFKSPDAPELLDRGGYFDLTGLDYASDLRRDTVLALEKLGIPIEYSHHERGPSQHEIDLRYTDALSMADAVMTYKLVVKEIALAHGVYASFMPMPLAGVPGNGMHVHQSLFDAQGTNLFYDASDPLGYNLSDLAKSYLAGIVKYAPEFSLVTNQCVNSYKRLAGGMEVPSQLSWARSDRSTLLRIPGYRPHRPDDCRVELRSPDPAANPYLAFAVMLAAGLAGIEENLVPGDPIDHHAAADDAQPAGGGAAGGPAGERATSPASSSAPGSLPATLGEAVELFAASKLMRDTLGEHIHSYLVATKRAEWMDYLRNVSEWELERYLAVL